MKDYSTRASDLFLELSEVEKLIAEYKSKGFELSEGYDDLYYYHFLHPRFSLDKRTIFNLRFVNRESNRIIVFVIVTQTTDERRITDIQKKIESLKARTKEELKEGYEFKLVVINKKKNTLVNIAWLNDSLLELLRSSKEISEFSKENNIRNINSVIESEILDLNIEESMIKVAGYAQFSCNVRNDESQFSGLSVSEDYYFNYSLVYDIQTKKTISTQITIDLADFLLKTIEENDGEDYESE